MNWYKQSNLKETLKKMPKNKALTDFLAAFGFDAKGNPIDYKSDKTDEERRREHDEEREREYEHIPA